MGGASLKSYCSSYSYIRQPSNVKCCVPELIFPFNHITLSQHVSYSHASVVVPNPFPSPFRSILSFCSSSKNNKNNESVSTVGVRRASISNKHSIRKGESSVSARSHVCEVSASTMILLLSSKEQLLAGLHGIGCTDSVKQ